MNGQSKNSLPIIQCIETQVKLVLIKFTFLLFIGFLIGIYTLTVNASELENTTLRDNSGYYDGSYGRGAFWPSNGLYSSIFNNRKKINLITEAPDSVKNTLAKSDHEITKKPVKYFIYSGSR